MRTKEFLMVIMVVFTMQNVHAWGPEGHRVIGAAAFELLDDSTRRQVLEMLGSPEPEATGGALAHACNWPDTIRDEPEWRWSSPLHYVNIPRHSEEYDRERDCREGRCVTEGILHFAGQLTYGDPGEKKRWQAFAFVCHLVADLHQPLHAGFRDDRGGNTVTVEFRGDEWNLHQFWDSVVVRAYLEDEDAMVTRIAESARAQARHAWNPAQVKAWTEESHALAAGIAYPDGRVISEEFAQRSWAKSLAQWERAAGRLARILNAVLGESESRAAD